MDTPLGIEDAVFHAECAFRKFRGHSQKAAEEKPERHPRAAAVDTDRHARDVAETHGAGDGSGQRLEMGHGTWITCLAVFAAHRAHGEAEGADVDEFENECDDHAGGRQPEDHEEGFQLRGRPLAGERFERAGRFLRHSQFLARKAVRPLADAYPFPCALIIGTEIPHVRRARRRQREIFRHFGDLLRIDVRGDRVENEVHERRGDFSEPFIDLLVERLLRSGRSRRCLCHGKPTGEKRAKESGQITAQGGRMLHGFRNWQSPCQPASRKPSREIVCLAAPLRILVTISRNE